MVPEVCTAPPHPHPQAQAGIRGELRRSLGVGEECRAHLHIPMEGKELPETRLRLASGASPQDIVDTEGTSEGVAVQRGHPAVQFPDEQ